MAAYTVAAGAIGVHAKTLAANTVDTVAFTDDVDWVEIVSDGAAAVYVTVDGTTPTVAGGGTWEMPAGVRSVLTLPSPQPYATRTETVSLISAGAATYGVRKASEKFQLGLRVGGAGSSSGSPVLVDTASAVPTAIVNAATATATKYRGISVSETTNSATAKVRVRDLNATGTILDTITLIANEAVSYAYPAGRAVASGTIYIQVVSGSVEGSVFSS